MNIEFAQEIGNLARERLGKFVKCHVSGHPIMDTNAMLRLEHDGLTVVVMENPRGEYVIKPALGALINYTQPGDYVPPVSILPSGATIRTQLVNAIVEIWDQSRVYTYMLMERKQGVKQLATDRRSLLKELAQVSGNKVGFDPYMPDFWHRGDETTLSGEITQDGGVRM